MNGIHRYTALLKNPHFWYIAGIIAGCSAFYYAPSIIDFMGWPKVGWEDAPHDVQRALFVIPVLYAAYRFGLRGVIATALISMAVFLPRALFISPYDDPLMRAMAFVGVIGAIGILTAKLSNNVTERKRAEAKFKRAAEEWETTFDSINDLISIQDTDFKLIRVNKAFADTFKIRPEELIGRACYELVHGTNEPVPHCPFKKLQDTGKPQLAEFFEPYLGIHLDVNTSPIFDDEGKTIACIHIARDITERKRAEQAISEQRDRAQRYLDVAGVMFIAIDADERVSLVNKRACEVLGYSEEEIMGKNWFDTFLPERIRGEVRSVFRMLMAGEISPAEYFENPVLIKDGGDRAISWHNIALTDNAGNTIGTLGSGEDITERKEVEETLQKSEARYRELANSLPQIVFETDENGGLIFVNQAAFTSMGYSKDDFDKGLNALQMIVPYERDQAGENIRRILNGEEPDYRDFTIQRADGSTFPAIIHSKRVLLGDKVAGLRGIITDITESKRAEEKIKASLAEKELLLKEVHHRVKNNMQVISSLLKLQSGSVKDKEDAAVFKDSQDRIKSMALVYNKLYQAEDLAHIDFREYVRDLVRNLAPSYKAVSGKVTTSVEGNGVSLGVDQAIPCGLVINELITNSLKYAFPKGRGGEIRVSLAESEGEVELTVSDDGVGIPASLDLAGSKTLGLHLVGNLVEQLGGKIELDRTAGTKFRITFRKNQE